MPAAKKAPERPHEKAAKAAQFPANATAPEPVAAAAPKSDRDTTPENNAHPETQPHIAADPAASHAEPPPVNPRAAEAFGGEAEAMRNSKGFIGRIPKGKLAVGGAAAVATLGGWALYEKHRKSAAATDNSKGGLK
jgi:hypothetical protein